MSEEYGWLGSRPVVVEVRPGKIKTLRGRPAPLEDGLDASLQVSLDALMEGKEGAEAALLRLLQTRAVMRRLPLGELVDARQSRERAALDYLMDRYGVRNLMPELRAAYGRTRLLQAEVDLLRDQLKTWTIRRVE